MKQNTENTNQIETAIEIHDEVERDSPHMIQMKDLLIRCLIYLVVIIVWYFAILIIKALN